MAAEYLEGETLSDRLGKGVFPLEPENEGSLESAGRSGAGESCAPGCC